MTAPRWIWIGGTLRGGRPAVLTIPYIPNRVAVTIFLLATSAAWQGIVLGLCGFFDISSVEKLVRPILVGRDAPMPDYVVLIATLGGF